MTRFTAKQLDVESRHEGLEIEMDDGIVYTLQDPKAIKLDSLVNLESLPPIEQIKVIIADDKFEEFAARPEVDGYFFEAVMKKYVAHYGLDLPGNAPASLRS